MGDVIAHLRAQNQALEAQLAARDAECRELREVAEAAADLQSADQQAAKVIELSKKNRALNLALEKERARVSQLSSEISAGGNGGAAAGVAFGDLDHDSVQNMARGLVEAAAEQADAARQDAAMWKERMQQQTNKMSQMEQRVFAMEIETKKLTRALVREVGEDVPLARVLDEGSDWKGRREQVIALKEQVRQLKMAQGIPVPESRNEAAAKKAIGKISSNRSAEVEKLAGELAAVRADFESMTSKYASAISRRKVWPPNSLTLPAGCVCGCEERSIGA